jgi:hypothetical protein
MDDLQITNAILPVEGGKTTKRHLREAIAYYRKALAIYDKFGITNPAYKTVLAKF